MIYAAEVASTCGAWGGYPRPLPSRTPRIRGGATVAPDPRSYMEDLIITLACAVVGWLVAEVLL